jgi:hypothetical protein
MAILPDGFFCARFDPQFPPNPELTPVVLRIN